MGTNMIWLIVIIVGAVLAGIPIALLLYRAFPSNWFGPLDKLILFAVQYRSRQRNKVDLVKLYKKYQSLNVAQNTISQNQEKTTFEAKRTLTVDKLSEITSPKFEPIDNKDLQPKFNKNPENGREEPKIEITPVKHQPVIFAEIESNLKIASTPSIDDPVSFQTKVWDGNQDEVNKLPVDIQSELREIYIDMRLANDIVWLITEFDNSTMEVALNYNNLCSKIAERVTRILDISSRLMLDAHSVNV